jgi:hypothetical protein
LPTGGAGGRFRAFGCRRFCDQIDRLLDRAESLKGIFDVRRDRRSLFSITALS